MTSSTAAVPNTAGRDELPDVGVDPDLQEEDRNEQMRDRRELARARGPAAGLRGERDAGDERADDRRELGRVRELGDRERERERDRDERARRAAVAPHPGERLGGTMRTPTRVVSTTKPTATTTTHSDPEDRDRALRSRCA